MIGLTRNSIFILLTISLIFSKCIQIIHPKKTIETKTIFQEDTEFHKGLWVRAASMASPDSIERIINIALDLGITDIYAQVVVGGYAYYQSQMLPRSQYLSKVSGSYYDPLDSLLNVAHKNSIRVHAWVNALLVWSLEETPDSTNHIYYKHPDWFINDVLNKNMVDYTHEEWTNAGLEGLYLDPAHKEVRKHLKMVCMEIVGTYPVAGIHLDFIRYPGTLWGLPKNDTTAIFAGFRGHKLRWLNLTRYPQLSFLSRWMCWHYWKMNKNKEKNIFEIIAEIYNVVNDHAINQDCALSTAVLPNPSLARYRFAQNWMKWGTVLDYPVVMSYTKDRSFFARLLNFTIKHKPETIFGIGLLWPEMGSDAYLEVQAVKSRGGKGICYFDFTSLDTMADYNKLKGSDIHDQEPLLNDTLVYPKIDSVFTDMPGPDFIKKGKSLLSPGEEFEFSEFLLSLSLDAEMDLMRMKLEEKSFRNKISEDIAAFIMLDAYVFPLPDSLIEPPKRQVDYELMPWEDEDTIVVKTKAKGIKELTQHMSAYPNSLNGLARAVFNAEIDKREILTQHYGIYIFETKKIQKGGKLVWRNDVPPDLLPVYISWTIEDIVKTVFSK